MKSIAWRTLSAGLVLSVVTLTALAQQEERETGRRKGGESQTKKGLGGASKKSAAGKGQMQGRGGMPMFKVGAVIPPFMIGQLDLSEKQQAAIEKLEADVAKELKEILNEEQFEMLSRPPQMGPGGFGPGGPGGPGGRGFGPGGPGGPGGRGGFGPGGPEGRGFGPGGEEGGPPQKGARGKGEGRRKPAPPPEDQ